MDAWLKTKGTGTPLFSLHLMVLFDTLKKKKLFKAALWLVDNFFFFLQEMMAMFHFRESLPSAP